MCTQRHSIPVLAILSFTLAACQGVAAVTHALQPSPTILPGEPTATATGLSTPPVAETQLMPDPTGTPSFVIETGLDPVIALAIEDLASSLGLAPDRVEVLEARAVVWPDSSLGCPQPGMAYQQVPEDGVLIRLAAGGQSYDYHGGGRDPFLCEVQFPAVKDTPPKLDPDIVIPPPRD